MNVARTRIGLIPVISEAGIHVSALAAHIAHLQHVVFPKLPRRLEIPILHVRVWMLAVGWQRHRVGRARQIGGRRHGILNRREIPHPQLVQDGYASRCRRIELQNVDVVELSSEVKDAVSATNDNIRSCGIRETYPRTEIAVSDAPNRIGDGNKRRHRGVGDEVQSVDRMVDVLRRVEQVIAKAEVQRQFGRRFPIVLTVKGKAPLPRRSDRHSFRRQHRSGNPKHVIGRRIAA